MPTATDIALDDCNVQSDKFGKIKGVEEWYENQYILVMGEIGDYDFLFAPTIVIYKCPKGGGYKLIEDGIRNAMHFIMLPKATRGKMLDNDYVMRDQPPWAAPSRDELVVTREEDRVIWKSKDMEFIDRPPYWDVKGSVQGIEWDIKAHSIHPGIWYLGNFNEIEQNMSAGIDEYIQAEGTITVDGTKYEITQGGGLYEHVALPGWDEVSLLKPGGYLWLCGYSDDIQIFLFVMPGIESYRGKVIVDGKATYFEGREQVFIDAREVWTDPRSSIVTAVKWAIRMKSDEGDLDVMVSSGGRTFSVNCYSNGYLDRFYHLAMTEGNYKTADGRTLPIENVRMCVDDAKIFHTLK
jgi:hypothetical protein